jgi:hypothetical protein
VNVTSWRRDPGEHLEGLALEVVEATKVVRLWNALIAPHSSSANRRATDEIVA